MKPFGKGSFLRTVLRALGMDKSFASHLHAETQPSIPVRYARYVSTRTDLLKAEQATANVHAYMLMEIRKKTIL